MLVWAGVRWVDRDPYPDRRDDRMQIIEVTAMVVRSAVISLRRQPKTLRFVLFPMIHRGTPEFYAAVYERAQGCALIVAEGQRASRRTVSLRGLACRLLRRRRRNRLVIQDMCEETLGVPVVRLHRLPALTYLLARVSIWVLVSWLALYILTFGAERFLTRELALDDDGPFTQPSAGERWDAIDEVILDDRDTLLVDALANPRRAWRRTYRRRGDLRRGAHARCRPWSAHPVRLPRPGSRVADRVRPRRLGHTPDCQNSLAR